MVGNGLSQGVVFVEREPFSGARTGSQKGIFVWGQKLEGKLGKRRSQAEVGAKGAEERFGGRDRREVGREPQGDRDPGQRGSWPRAATLGSERRELQTSVLRATRSSQNS